MTSICFYMHVHQPWRLRNFSIFEIGTGNNYFDDNSNKMYLERIAQKSYLPTNKILLDLIKNTNKKFKIALSISGNLIEQLEKYSPEALQSFKDLVNTGNVELIVETYYHSLSFLYSINDFERQVQMHKDKLKRTFKKTPEVFRNVELTFRNDMAEVVEKMGFKGILSEGADHILGWRSPNFLYNAKSHSKIPLLLRNYNLSDDISFRFSTREWKEWPLTSEKFAYWINQTNGNGEVVNLFMDYETFGEHQWEETGIFEFLKRFPFEILKNEDNEFVTPIEAIKKYEPKGELNIEKTISWADVERDISAWVGNKMQEQAITHLYEMENEIIKKQDEKIIEDWRKLQTSDHFYYMCTKWFAEGDIHKYFNPYDSPYEAFITFINIINDLKMRLGKNKK